MDVHPTNPDARKVKREGGHGWHWVYPYDPAVHVLFDAPVKDHVHVPADYEVDGRDPPNPTPHTPPKKRTPRKKAG